MRKVIIIIVIALSLSGPAQAQEQQQRETWNEIFTKRQGREFPHNKFLAETIRGRQPGKALDIGTGEGRNALFLAAQGWDVTGFDVSDVGVRLAREAAQKSGLKLQAVIDDVDRYEYGIERWDLVVGMYMHAPITRNAAKIVESLKPGGLVVIEGSHRDLNRKGLEGQYFGYRSNELLRAFDRLRVLRYEDTVAPADWERNSQEAPIVRFLGVKDPTTSGSR